MAYEIKQRNEADYRFYRFQGEPELLERLDHNLKITDGVLRFRIFKVDPERTGDPAARRSSASVPPPEADRRRSRATARAAAIATSSRRVRSRSFRAFIPRGGEKPPCGDSKIDVRNRKEEELI